MILKSESINLKNQKFKITEYDDTPLTVYIYGTSDLKNGVGNFIADLNITLNSKENVFGFHTGCWNAGLKILDYLENHYDLDKMEIILGGHSMGGSIAECLAFICHDLLSMKVMHVASFGGYPVCSKSAPYPVFRFSQGYDKVPSMFKKYTSRTCIPIKSRNRGDFPFKFYWDHIKYDVEELTKKYLGEWYNDNGKKSPYFEGKSDS